MAQLSHEQKMEMLFTALVEQWQAQAWIALGKVPNPATNKIERNLELAKMAIDMLDMIKEKTSGNLTDTENRMITKIIADLKLNYVDEYEREKREKQQAQQKESSEQPAKTAEDRETAKPTDDSAASTASASGEGETAQTEGKSQENK